MPIPNWTATRAKMLLDPSVVNLNTGSFGPLPRTVFERVTALRRQLADEPMNFLLRTAPPLLWQARSHLASIMGTWPRQIVFTANATSAINLVAASLCLKSPGEILITDHEYGAMVWCWERAARRMGLTLKTFALPRQPKKPQAIVDAACAAMTRKTRLLFFSHVLSPTGMVLPARDLYTEARSRKILTVMDGAHAPGFIDVHLISLRAD